MTDPTCTFCGKTATPDEAEHTMHRTYEVGDTDSYSCREAHDCRWRMLTQLRALREPETAADAALAIERHNLVGMLMSQGMGEEAAEALADRSLASRIKEPQEPDR